MVAIGIVTPSAVPTPIVATIIPAFLPARILAVIAAFMAKTRITLLVARNVFPLVPVILDKIDPLTAGVVLAAVLTPMFCVPRRHIQINRRSVAGNPTDHHRLRINQYRLRVVAYVDAAIEARLANAYRHADIGGEHRRGDQSKGEDHSFHKNLQMKRLQMLAQTLIPNRRLKGYTKGSGKRIHQNDPVRLARFLPAPTVCAYP